MPYVLGQGSMHMSFCTRVCVSAVAESTELDWAEAACAVAGMPACGFSLSSYLNRAKPQSWHPDSSAAHFVFDAKLTVDMSQLHAADEICVSPASPNAQANALR